MTDSKIRRIAPIAVMIGGAFAANQAIAFSGYEATVRSACATGSRPAPVIAADVCSTCHSGSNYGASTAAKTAYRAGGTALLDFFCAAPTPTNLPPSVTVPSTSVAGVEGTAVAFTVSVTDDAGRANVTLTSTALPSGATFNAATGAFAWTPATGASTTSPYSITFTATDQGELTDTVTVNLTVTAANTGGGNVAPTLQVPAAQTVTVNKPLTFSVSATDQDGDLVTLTASNLPAGATFKQDSGQNANGQYTGVFTWTPTTVGSYSVTFKAADDFTTPASATSTVRITVSEAPTTGGGAVSSISLGEANWNRRSSKLKVSGTVKGSNVAGLFVSIYDAATGAKLGTAMVGFKGTWSFVKAGLKSAPCSIKADADGVTATRWVRGAPESCRGDDDDDHEDEDRSRSGR